MTNSVTYLDTIFALEDSGMDVFPIMTKDFINGHIVDLQNYTDYTKTVAFVKGKGRTTKVTFTKCNDINIESLTKYPYISIINEPLNTYKKYDFEGSLNDFIKLYLEFLGNRSDNKALIFFGNLLTTLIDEYLGKNEIGVIITDNTFTLNIVVANRTFTIRINKTLI